MILNGPGRGWTESYFQVRTDNSLVDAINQFKQVADQRTKLLGDGYNIQGYRAAFVTDDNLVKARGGSYVKLDTLPSTAGNEDGDFSDTAVLVMWKNLDSTRTKYTYLRGVWDSVVVGEGSFFDSADWKKNFNSFKGAITKGGYGWYGRQPNNTMIPLTSYTVDAGEVVTFTFPANTFLLADLFKPIPVSFQGINVNSRLNGQQVIVPTTLSTAQLKKPLAVGPYVSGGFMRKLTYEFVAITQGIGFRIVSRKTGTPLFVSRGRQRARSRT
jgi:hypothetical protein